MLLHDSEQVALVVDLPHLSRDINWSNFRRVVNRACKSRMPRGAYYLPWRALTPVGPVNQASLFDVGGMPARYAGMEFDLLYLGYRSGAEVQARIAQVLTYEPMNRKFDTLILVTGSLADSPLLEAAACFADRHVRAYVVVEDYDNSSAALACHNQLRGQAGLRPAKIQLINLLDIERHYGSVICVEPDCPQRLAALGWSA